MKRSTKTMLAGAALAGLLTGSLAAAGSTTTTASGKTGINKAGVMADEKGGDKHGCAGKNDCKGKGGCKTGDGGCKGKNTCKGKGGCATDASKHGKKK
jgi:hypothetical protein